MLLPHKQAAYFTDSTSTNRYYLPMMVVMIDRRDKQSIQRLMNQRTWVVGGLVLILLAILIFSGQKILAYSAPISVAA